MVVIQYFGIIGHKKDKTSHLNMLSFVTEAAQAGLYEGNGLMEVFYYGLKFVTINFDVSNCQLLLVTYLFRIIAIKKYLT